MCVMSTLTTFEVKRSKEAHRLDALRSGGSWMLRRLFLSICLAGSSACVWFENLNDESVVPLVYWLLLSGSFKVRVAALLLLKQDKSQPDHMKSARLWFLTSL